MKKFLIVLSVLIIIILITKESYAKSINIQTSTKQINAQTNSFQNSEYINSKDKTNENSIINTQKENLNISDFIKESETYIKDTMPGLNLNDLFTSAVTGSIDNVKLIHFFLNIFGKEITNSLTVITSIIVIIVIHSILKSFCDGLENKGVVQIAYYVQYILIVTVVLTNFAGIIAMVKTSIQNLVSFINMLIPILITLLITTGSITSASMIQPMILFLTTLIGNFIVNVAIPIILVSTALGIISQLSDKLQIDKLSKFLKSSTIWALGIILTIFVGVASLEGSLTSQVDGLSAKTTKAAVSSFIPVVGKILGDAVETVMGCSIILKNALGIVGVIIIIGICITPIIKLLTLMTMYYLCSALCQPIADAKIIKLLSHIGDTYKLLLAILCSVSVMLIIGITIVIKMSNTGILT